MPITANEFKKVCATALRRCYYDKPWSLALPGLTKRFIFSISPNENDTSSSPYWRIWRAIHDSGNLKPYRSPSVKKDKRPMPVSNSTVGGSGHFVAIYDWCFTMYPQNEEDGYYSIFMYPLATAALDTNVDVTIFFRPEYILNAKHPSRKPIETEKVFDKFLGFHKEYNGMLYFNIINEERIDVCNLIPTKGAKQCLQDV